MSQTSSAPPDDAHAQGERKAPSVLVVLVVKDGVPWLRDCLSSLSKQTHPRLGVLAVDNGSTDGSRELLVRALGAERVLALGANRGFPGGLRAALETEVASKADYLLFLHDDASLDPEGVARLVEAAQRIDGAGVVGPKVVDWEDPEILREVGLSTDRFGYPYSPLEEDEIDHGQYDRIREVLFVSSSAMLVSKAAWMRAGLPDERLAARFEDLDFCWRARLAGFRVLMTPHAVVRHRAATARRERGSDPDERDRSRYYAERAALAAMLKNYGLLSLLWVLPLYAVQGLGKLVLLAVSRRFEDVTQIMGAWWWNLTNLPGTVRRRVRAQSVRAVPDRAIRRYMAPATIRLRRWVDIANEILLGRAGEGEGEEGELDEELMASGPLRSRAFAVVRDHPVAVAWFVTVVMGLFAFRHLWGPEVVTGGALAPFPEGPAAFFRELGSGVRTTGLGGTEAASPGLALLGGFSVLLLGSTAVAQKALLVLLPVLAAFTFYRASLRRTERMGAAVVASGCYALSGIALWALSEGRVPELILLATLPPLADRLAVAFGRRVPENPTRFAIGTGVVLAVGAALFPGAVLAFGLLAAGHLAVPTPQGRRGRGLALVAAGTAAGAALLFPLVMDLVSSGGGGLGSPAGTTSLGLLSRLAPGPGVGSWAVAWFLPVAALVSFALVEGDASRPALRNLLILGAAIPLAWLSSAGYLPGALSNAPAYLAAGAFAACALVAGGLAWALPRMGRHAFGIRQLGVAVLVSLLSGGVALTSTLAARASWEVGPNRLPAAWPVVAEADPELEVRVLWLGRAGPEELPPPVGDPAGTIVTRAGALRYAIVGRQGRTALDLGRDGGGPGYDYLERALATVLSGSTRHAGSILAPLAVGHVVAAQGDLPAAVLEVLDAQLDLDAVPAGGLVIFRNAAALPRAAGIEDPGSVELARSDELPLGAARDDLGVTELEGGSGAFAGRVDDAAYVLLADSFADGWRLEAGGREVEPEPAFGWATGFVPPAGETDLVVRYGEQRIWTLQIALLAVLWAAALWVTRKPARRIGARRLGGRASAEEAREEEVPA